VKKVKKVRAIFEQKEFLIGCLRVLDEEMRLTGHLEN